MTAQEIDQMKTEELALLRDENCRLCDEQGGLPRPVMRAYALVLEYERIDAALQKAKGGAK